MRVEDLEEALRAAASTFRAATSDERSRMAKSVRALARRLVAARRHLLKSELLHTETASAERASPREPQVSALRKRLEALEASGIETVFLEFGVGDIRRTTGG
jgi:hypothetical protein